MRSMSNKVIILSILLAICSCVSIIASQQDASLSLSGTVELILSVETTGTPTPGIAYVDMSGPSGGYQPLFYVVERSNSPSGYKIKMTSDKNFRLRQEDPAIADELLYELEYNNQKNDAGITYTGSFAAGDLVYTITNSDGLTPPEGLQKVMKIRYGNPKHLASGTYTDVLRFSIEIK